MNTYLVEWTQPQRVFADRVNPYTKEKIEGWGQTTAGGMLKIKAKSKEQALDFFCESNEIRPRELRATVTLLK